MPDMDKPPELLALHPLTAHLFDALGKEFDVGPTYILNLKGIDAAEQDLAGRDDLVALMMRRLQALRLTATAGKRTVPDVVITLIAATLRPLEEMIHAQTEREDLTRILKRSIDPLCEAALVVGEIANGENPDDPITLI